MPSREMTTVRLDPGTRDRVTSLVDLLTQKGREQWASIVTINRSDVLREALRRGLDAMELEHQADKKKAAPKRKRKSK